MRTQETIIKNLAKKYNLDHRIVKEVVYSPLKFTNRVVKDPMDMRPIRIMYFALFVQKPKKNKANRMSGMIETLLENIKDVTVAMYANSIEEAKKIINNAKEAKDYLKIKEIFDAWQEYIK